MAHNLTIVVQTVLGSLEVSDYAAAMIVAIANQASEINAEGRGELAIHYGARHGVRLYRVRRMELIQMPVHVE